MTTTNIIATFTTADLLMCNGEKYCQISLFDEETFKLNDNVNRHKCVLGHRKYKRNGRKSR
jgi:hypothetical protein